MLSFGKFLLSFNKILLSFQEICLSLVNFCLSFREISLKFVNPVGNCMLRAMFLVMTEIISSKFVGNVEFSKTFLEFWTKNLSFWKILEFFQPWVFELWRKNKPGLRCLMPFPKSQRSFAGRCSSRESCPPRQSSTRPHTCNSNGTWGRCQWHAPSCSG